MNKINVGELSFLLRAFKISISKNGTGPDWDQKITSLLKRLPQKYTLTTGEGEITNIQLNRDKSEYNKLVFTFTVKSTLQKSKTYELTLTPCWILSFTLSITEEGKNSDESIAKELMTYFNIIFYYEHYDGISQL